MGFGGNVARRNKILVTLRGEKDESTESSKQNNIVTYKDIMHKSLVCPCVM